MIRTLPMRHRVALDAVVAIAAAAIIFGAVTVANDWSAWEPLGDYPVQRVTSTVSGRETPTVRAGEDVTTEATKCVTEDHPVTVRAQGRWTMVDPAGFSTDYQLGQAERLPGCTRTTYTSPMPVDVMARVLALCARGQCETVWRKDGIETPVDSDGNEGEPRFWFTGNFTIIAR